MTRVAVTLCYIFPIPVFLLVVNDVPTMSRSKNNRRNNINRDCRKKKEGYSDVRKKWDVFPAHRRRSCGIRENNRRDRGDDRQRGKGWYSESKVDASQRAVLRARISREPCLPTASSSHFRFRASSFGRDTNGIKDEWRKNATISRISFEQFRASSLSWNFPFPKFVAPRTISWFVCRNGNRRDARNINNGTVNHIFTNSADARLLET